MKKINANQWIAIGTWALAVVTLLLVWDTISDNETRLTLAYPPKVKLSTIEFTPDKGFYDVEVLFVNVGRGDAHLIPKDHICLVFWGPDVLPIAKVKIYRRPELCKMDHPVTDSLHGISTPDASIMRPGDFWFGHIKVPDHGPDSVNSKLWAVGFVYYEDGLNPPTRHGVYFGRWYDPSKDRFIHLKDDAYEAEE